MRNLFGSLFAIGVAGIAAVAATTAMLNSPLSIGPATDKPATASQTAPPADPGGNAATPDAPPDATPGGAPTATPDAAPSGAAPAGAADEGEKPDEVDKDPYEGIAPEELPPDLQYDADSSVSFPTNI